MSSSTYHAIGQNRLIIAIIGQVVKQVKIRTRTATAHRRHRINMLRSRGKLLEARSTEENMSKRALRQSIDAHKEFIGGLLSPNDGICKI